MNIFKYCGRVYHRGQKNGLWRDLKNRISNILIVTAVFAAVSVLLVGAYWVMSCLLLGEAYSAYPKVEAYAAETETEVSEITEINTKDRIFDEHIVIVPIP